MLGETKLVPPRKGKNANYLSIKHVYLRVARGDFLERMGQQFLNYAGGAPKLYINRLGLLPDTHGKKMKKSLDSYPRGEYNFAADITKLSYDELQKQVENRRVLPTYAGYGQDFAPL